MRNKLTITLLFITFFNVYAQKIIVPLSKGGANDGGTILSVDPSNGSYTSTYMEGVIGTVETVVGYNNGVPTETSGLYYESSNNSIYITSEKGERVIADASGQGVILKYNVLTKEVHLIKSFKHCTTGLNDCDGSGLIVTGQLTKVGNKLYGVTHKGGQHNYGVIYSIDISTDEYKVEYALNGTSDGGYPSCQLYADGTTLYGGGGFGNGNAGLTIFSFNTTNSTYTTLHQESTGSPVHGVAGIYLRGGTTQLYYTAYTGIQMLDLSNLLAGPTTHFNGLATNESFGYKGYGFTHIPNGDKWLVTFENGGANNFGSIAQVDYSGTDHVTTIHNFSGGSSGQSPVGKLTLGFNVLYGVTSISSINDQCMLYELTTSNGTIRNLHTFNKFDEGLTVTAAPVIVNNKLYGITEMNGLYNSGSIWSYDINTSTFAIELNLGFPNGKTPLGGLSLNPTTNKLAFTTFQGGSNLESTVVINSFDQNQNTYSKLNQINTLSIKNVFHKPFFYNSKTFVLAEYGSNYGDSQASFYGIVELDQNGAIVGTPINIYAQADPIERLKGIVYSNVIQEGALLYGASKQLLWKVDLNTGAYTTLYTYTTNIDGSTPTTILKEGDNIYGINSTGGNNNAGTIFKYSITTNTFQTLVSTSSGEEFIGIAKMNNDLYSLVQTVSNLDCKLVKLDITTPSIIDVASIDKTTIGKNAASQISIINGDLYAIFNEGGPNGLGGLMKYTIANSNISLLLPFSQTTGYYSYNSEIYYLSQTTSIDENKINSNYFALYPNPCSDVLFVNVKNIKGLDILTLNGVKIKSNKNSDSISIAELKEGSYLIKITTASEVYTEMFIKK